LTEDILETTEIFFLTFTIDSITMGVSYSGCQKFIIIIIIMSTSVMHNLNSPQMCRCYIIELV